ncbi:MAG: DNA recombination protein RmuC [Synergistaceae bacterium]|nr:DNA recombination protein RmuC [Synergistaceae bacterium]
MYLVIILAVAVLFIAAYVIATVSKLKDNSGAMEQIARELMVRLQKIEGRLEDTERGIQEELVSMRKEQREDARAGREEQARGILSLGDTQAQRIKEIGDLQRESLSSLSQQLTNISRLNEEKLEAIRATVETKLQELYKSNEEKLEKMRATVDEQLHSTLEKRLGEAFTNVSERLEQVHKGLGEMRALTSDVGDLKKVLSNVKVRGMWGEMQLHALLEQILTPDQYAENVATRPNCSERVEFAISLPGAGDGSAPVWLPIDSKFPLEDYQRLVTASEAGDAVSVIEIQKSLKQRVIEEAKTIRDKYLEPPYTTDFGILYLPVEGLYAEVLRIDGLSDMLAHDYRVVPAGPTTVTALLNSLQMGFRTLAIEKRSSEVWILLGKVKTEFDRFGGVLEKTKQKIDQAGKELERAGARSRAITRALRDVQGLPVTGEEGFVQNELDDGEMKEE